MGLIDGTQLVIEQAMAGAAARQQVLANNIANADTPNFMRSDLDFHTQLANAVDADSKEQLMSIQFHPVTDAESPVQANGNNVNLDGEMANMSQNALDYETLVGVASARLKMISTAIGSAGS